MMTNQPESDSVTIFEVAKLAGVSHTTVSRVINNNTHVMPETRERVLAAMDTLGYVANRQARLLAGGTSNNIGVLVPDLGTGYIGEIMRGIDAELSLENYDLTLFTTHRIASKEAGYVMNLARGMADGMLLVLPRNPVDYFEFLTNQKYPFVLIDHQGSGSACPSVGATNWQGAYNATEYLIKLGHRRIGFIVGSPDLGAAVDRFKGYKSALKTHHIPLDEALIYQGDFFQPDGYAGGKTLLSLKNPPTAIFASNDSMAIGVMDAVREMSLRIPDDISVMGFDDIPQAAMVRPGLTTVRQPLEEMGRVATQMLLDMLKKPNKIPERIELPTGLVIRDSTGRPKDKAV